MDDQTKALVDDALKNHPNASIQVINVNTPGTVIMIGGNYFANSSKKKQATQEKEEKIELPVGVKDATAVDSTPVNERSVSLTSCQVEESAVKAARKILVYKDELVNSIAESNSVDDMAKSISQKGIAQQIIDAIDVDAIGVILDQHFPDAPF